MPRAPPVTTTTLAFDKRRLPTLWTTEFVIAECPPACRRGKSSIRFQALYDLDGHDVLHRDSPHFGRILASHHEKSIRIDRFELSGNTPLAFGRGERNSQVVSW